MKSTMKLERDLKNRPGMAAIRRCYYCGRTRAIYRRFKMPACRECRKVVETPRIGLCDELELLRAARLKEQIRKGR